MGRQPPEPRPSPMEGCPFRLTTCYPDTIFLHKPNIMNKNIYVIACALALATVSCENTVPAVTNPEAETVIIANIGGEAGVSSRTAVDPTDYFGGHVGILWTPDDAIGVFGGTVVNARFTCDATRPAGRASFSGNCAGPEYAYYPYSAANDGADPKTLAGQLPAQQSYDSATGSLTGDWKYGRRREGAEGEFDFSHVFALLRFNVNATGTLLSGERLKGVTLELPEGRELAGDFTFDAITGSYRFTGSTSHAVTVQWTDTPELKAGKTCTAYMSVAPDLHADDEVTVTVTTDRHTATFTRHIAYDFAPNSVYTFNLALSEFQDGMEVEELPVEPEEETANCYMITTAGEHDFKATVIGNGQKGIIPGAGFHTEDASISPASARLLWEDVSGFVSKVELRDGRVYYTTTGNVGNAVIAVYDTAGTILWSWHVWGVGDTLPQDFTYETRTVAATPLAYSSVRMMDRDLGAFPATDAERCPKAGERDASIEARVINAMLYQWGRKDPFPNSGKYYGADGQEVDLLANKYNILKPAADEATILYAIQHPAAFIDLYTTAGVSDWLYKHNDMLWGDGRFSGKNVEGWTDVKTIYDPSPVGYRVQNYYAYTYFIPVDKNYNQLKGVMSMTNPSDGSESYPSLRDAISCVIEPVPDGSVTRYLPKGVTMDRIGMSVDNKKQHGYGIFMKRNADDAEGNFFAQTGNLQGGGSRDSYGISSYRWMSCGAVTNTIDCAASQLYYFAWRTAQSDYTDSDHNKGLPSGSAGVVGTVRSQYSLQPRSGCAVRCVRDGVE